MSALTRFVMSAHRVKLVSALPERSSWVNPVRPAGKAKLVSELPSRKRVSRFVSPPGREHWASELKPMSSTVRLGNGLGRIKLVRRLLNRSRIVRFVNALGRAKFVKELESKSRIFKLRAASSPCTLLIFRQQALRLVNLIRSCSVNGPVGFCKASRMAALRPGSGMDTSCAKVEDMKPVKISV